MKAYEFLPKNKPLPDNIKPLIQFCDKNKIAVIDYKVFIQSIGFEMITVKWQKYKQAGDIYDVKIFNKTAWGDLHQYQLEEVFVLDFTTCIEFSSHGSCEVNRMIFEFSLTMIY